MIIQNKLPVNSYLTSVKSIQAGAIFSRDWAPLHSDYEWAVNKANLPNIIMNNYTFNGLVIKYVTDIFGESSRIGKVSFNIKKPICPNETLEFHGKVVEKEKVKDNISILNIEINIKISKKVVSNAKVLVGVDLTDKQTNTPWKIDHKTWKSYIKSNNK
tara:strand:+ start:71 stop:547 length:477 start_codon:yes stop_codon:yes gene_type:complete